MDIQETFDQAVQHQQAGNLQHAEYLYRQILAAAPQIPEVHVCLGVMLAQRGQLEESLTSFQRALHFRPDYTEAHNDMANVLMAVGRLDEAVEHYQRAIQLQPGYADAHNNLGVCLGKQDKLDESIAHLRAAVRISPNYAGAHYNLGAVLVRQDKLDEAIASYRVALRLQPALADAWNNLGIALELQDKLPEAVQSYREALRHRPAYAEVYDNLGKAFYKRGRIDEALAYFEQALGIDPQYVEAHFNRALLWLLLGEFDKGWPEYEWRWSQARADPRLFALPLWDGSDLHGRTILLQAEQGLGDTLQFIRYAPLVAQRGGRVVVECQSSLLGLLGSVPGIEHLVPIGAAAPPCALRAPLLSLPGIFRTALANPPAKVPYLSVEESSIEQWRQILTTALGQRPRAQAIKVGIAWQGNPGHRGDRQRSIPLTMFEQLAAQQTVQLISLQIGPGTEQLRGLAGRFDVLDLQEQLGGDLESFTNLAALMMNLDLVISCDTAVCHLAGALGMAVWVALPLVPDWRWELQKQTTAWYPTMRLFRQTQYGQWGDVFQRMADALHRLSGSGW
jgi:tetratricopeptide (TPR) repeat protein